MTYGAFHWFMVAVLALAVGAELYDKLADCIGPSERERELAEARSAYESGEITLAEYERRAEFLVDDRNERIRAVVEEINGIGDARAKAIAREFASVNAVATASREELTTVHGIGEQRADAIREYLSDDRESM
jgi:excinuclease ABC subunit C